MQPRAIARGKHRDHRAGRQDGDVCSGRSFNCRAVSGWRKRQQGRVMDKPHCVGQANKRSARHVCQMILVSHMKLGAGDHPRPMQCLVHGDSAWNVTKRALPCRYEGLVVFPAALGAGAMTRSHSHGFVEKEQLRVIRTGAHGFAPPAPKIQLAGDPVPVFPPRSAKFLSVIVQNASISHQSAAPLWRRDDGAIRHHAILQRHTIMSFVAASVSAG